MSESSMPWIKLHTRLLDDPRFGRLPDATQARYFKLLMLAGRCDAGGAFFKGGDQLTEDDIAYALHTTADDLRSDLNVLKNIGYVCLNGHGWEISTFLLEQGPSQEEKREQWNERQRKHREKIVTGDSPVSQASKSQESRVRVKSQSQDIESSVSDPTQKMTDDDISMTDKKRLICTHAGIPPQYSQLLIISPTILPEDLLASLAWNYSRKGEGKGKVKNPGIITGMNLAKQNPERPSADWYNQDRWLMHLPGAVKQKIGLCFNSDDNEVDNLPAVVTRNCDAEEMSPDERAWMAALAQLDLPRRSLVYLQDAKIIDSHNDVFTISCLGIYADWLTDHLTKSVENILVGICNRQVNVKFIGDQS